MSDIDVKSNDMSVIGDFVYRLVSEHNEVKLVNLSTTDGFNIYSWADDDTDIEPDKLSAIASSLCSLSTASTEELLKQKLRVATLETGAGNVLFLRTIYERKPMVLTVVATDRMVLGQARYVSRRLAIDIAKIPRLDFPDKLYRNAKNR